jgi:hypothetical protein
MTNSNHSEQVALEGFLDSMNSSTSAYSMFGPTQYPESVAFWHDPSAPTMTVTPSYTSQQASLLPLDHKKHKRTRSGCFTCRSRRIKCDETHPTCERCRKGSRDCVYPSSTSSSSSKSGARAAGKSRIHRPQSQGSDSSGKVEVESLSPLEPIIDEEEPDSAVSKSRPSTGHPSHKSQSVHSPSGGQDSSCVKDQSSSPSTESTRLESMSVRSGSIGHSTADLLSNARLPDDLRFYLNFHQDFMTTPHFFLRQSCFHFIHHNLIELALQYEPLLYALVGFSAYHHTLHISGGKLFTFLKYYNKALILLRKSLGSGEQHTEATLCTVLVLTTIEVGLFFPPPFRLCFRACATSC